MAMGPYGRPLEAKARISPVEAMAPAERFRLDLAVRPRRNRKADWTRRLLRENVLTVDDLIWPLFVADDTRSPVASMPGVERLSNDEVVRAGERAAKLEILAWRCFPIPIPICAITTGPRRSQPRKSRPLRGARHQEGGAGDRHHVRRGARSLYQPRP